MDDLLGGFSSEPQVQTGQQSNQQNEVTREETPHSSMPIIGNTQQNIQENISPSQQQVMNEPFGLSSVPQSTAKHVSFSETPQITTIPAETGDPHSFLYSSSSLDQNTLVSEENLIQTILNQKCRVKNNV